MLRIDSFGIFYTYTLLNGGGWSMRFGGGTAHCTLQFEARMQIFSSGFLILKVYRAVYFNCRSFLWSRVSRRVGPETLRQNCVKIVEDPEVTTYFNLKLSIL
jgi:hypothetical protein